jgi:hypothetical protein
MVVEAEIDTVREANTNAAISGRPAIVCELCTGLTSEAKSAASMR